jgi:hypothetical protein
MLPVNTRYSVRALILDHDDRIDADPPHVWCQQVTGAGYLAGYHGVINDYYVIRTPTFSPRGAMSDDQLAAEKHQWLALVGAAGDRRLSGD